MLGGLGDIQKLQQQAQKMQAALQQETVVIEKNGVKITMRGDQQILEVEIDGIIENRIAEAVNESVKKTQELAAKKLIEISQQG
ncbi:MAG: YbaB/EbfC family nucleoid-associated protein [Candidatus Roizmanbacteria bacterium]|jgi:DNA-binding protein YbaB|nr:YbaB/EbfC family nucleoid-associated protein [Candidatus Roizmanbacteria bacterium]MCX6732179.1 YbaB/EbfC family nucleoid-associated protein [Candidatus Roizmanbacteria bacterium]